MEEIILYKAFDGSVFDDKDKCLAYENILTYGDVSDSKDNPQEKEYLPHRAVGSVFECDAHKLTVKECTDEINDCLKKCFFGRHDNCLDYYDLHGPCVASDIGTLKSLYFEET